MSRVQLALNVEDLDEAITFYSKLFNTQPAKVKPGYANFAITQPPLKLVLMENPGHGGTLNHLGVEVATSDTVHTEIARLTDQGLFTEEELNTTCCFAAQDKVWVTSPSGERWEIYTVLADSDTVGPTTDRGIGVQGGQLGGVAVKPGHARAGVFGVEHCVGDQLPDVVVVQAVEDRGTFPAGADQPRHPQLRQMLRRRRGGFADMGGQVVDRHLPVD
jgi:catechol 2,3-dioxygenase-like lactoylglutathione lyase family enzyme